VSESNRRCSNIAFFNINRDPSTVQVLRDTASSVATSEGVQHQVTGFGEKLDEELWQRFRKQPSAIEVSSAVVGAKVGGCL
jgi:hypothetical protein